MKNNEIRKFIDLVESINDGLKNNDIINEANPFGQIAREGKILASELEPVFNVLKKDTSLAGPLLKKAGVSASDEFLKLIQNDFSTIDKLSTKVTKLLPKEAQQLRGAFELNVLKSSSTNKKLLSIAADNLVKDGRFIEKYKAMGNETDLVNKLKQNGYSDQGAKAIAQKRFQKNIPKPNPKPNPTPPPPVPPRYKNWMDEIIKRLKQKQTWKQILIWGLAIGIPASALYALVMNSGEKIPEDINESWAPCVQDLLDNKKGQLAKSPKGEISVLFKNETYPDGVQFYTNFRVMNLQTKQMGTWKCKSGKVEIQENENINEDDLNNIEITWDGTKKDEDKPKPQSKYHDCSKKDVNKEPLELFCKSPQILEIQECLGFEKKYRTGNFGPITMKALGGIKSITKEIYDKVKSNCKSTTPAKPDDIKINFNPPKDGEDFGPPKEDDTNTSTTTTPSKVDYSTGRNEYYNQLVQNYNNDPKTFPYIFKDGDRMKYKGLQPSAEDLAKLDSVMDVLQYRRIKQIPEKGYGIKYVWEKI